MTAGLALMDKIGFGTNSSVTSNARVLPLIFSGDINASLGVVSNRSSMWQWAIQRTCETRACSLGYATNRRKNDSTRSSGRAAYEYSGSPMSLRLLLIRQPPSQDFHAAPQAVPFLSQFLDLFLIHAADQLGSEEKTFALALNRLLPVGANFQRLQMPLVQFLFCR